mgnify:CR=1 FL=1
MVAARPPVAAAPAAVPAGQVIRVWAFPEGGGAPFYVGQTPGSGINPMALPDTSERLFAKVAIYCVFIGRSHQYVALQES